MITTPQFIRRHHARRVWAWLAVILVTACFAIAFLSLSRPSPTVRLITVLIAASVWVIALWRLLHHRRFTQYQPGELIPPSAVRIQVVLYIIGFVASTAALIWKLSQSFR